ncbi:MAG: B12-binding domain-containing radical SAM protein [Candidatus Omnitrophica bacterium]|nr:B12-binding domain-containing radical SAM protein [Candidatus Omnitrophota bacterium]
MYEKTILLIRPFFKNNFEINPPLGLLSIGSYLVNNGYPVKIIDVIAGDNYKEDIEANIKNYLFIGISAMTAQVPYALEISKYIKSMDNKIPVVWGGIHPTLYPKQVIADPNIDIVVPGEGEYACLELANHLKGENNGIKQVPGILYKDNNRNIVVSDKINRPVDLNSLPFLNYDLLYIEKYAYKNIDPTFSYSWVRTVGRHLSVIGSLGCKYRCAFCVNPIVYKRTQRMKSAGRLLDEIEYLMNKYNISFFYIRDEDFFGDKERIMEFLNLIEKKNLRFKWHTNVKASYFKNSYINEGLLKRMERAGLFYLSVGAESGSRRVLEILKKDIRLDDIRRVATFTKSTRIVIVFSFMIGIPDEGVEDVLKTIKFIRELKKINPKIFINGPQLYRPYPGASLYELCIRKGYNEPKNLADWVQALDRYSGYLSLEELPWVNQSGTFKLIYLYSRVMFKNVFTLKRDFRLLYKAPLFLFLKLIAEFRFRSNLWSIPFEVVLHSLFIKKHKKKKEYV